MRAGHVFNWGKRLACKRQGDKRRRGKPPKVTQFSITQKHVNQHWIPIHVKLLNGALLIHIVVICDESGFMRILKHYLLVLVTEPLQKWWVRLFRHTYSHIHPKSSSSMRFISASGRYVVSYEHGGGQLSSIFHFISRLITSCNCWRFQNSFL